MVLQSNNINTKINGWASPGEVITVDTVIRGSYQTVADKQGYFDVFVQWLGVSVRYAAWRTACLQRNNTPSTPPVLLDTLGSSVVY